MGNAKGSVEADKGSTYRCQNTCEAVQRNLGIFA